MAKMVKCKTCGADVAKGAKACPACGKDNRSFFAKHKIISGILILVVLVVGVNALGGGKDSGNAATGSTSSSKDSKVADTKITYDNFMSVKMGIDHTVALNL